MTTVTIKFDLNNDDDKDDYKTFNKMHQFKRALNDIRSFIRCVEKNGFPEEYSVGKVKNIIFDRIDEIIFKEWELTILDLE